MGGVEVVAQRLGFQPSHEWFKKEYEDVQVEGVLLYGPSTNVYWGGGTKVAFVECSCGVGVNITYYFYGI